ncbi:VOC family protein [Sphingobacterium hungaricum]|uniref:Glyoxalase n=1 Tax=Sphingobacterium hungaricum TaxID=2082723 RepID=A0A928UZU9_9SPHI|nr:VOC family protein [Sphingobacterium hungaricum]MBE8714396.1 glyoxalase [Sphingobacterium hungaricum]
MDNQSYRSGQIFWSDLTTENASNVRDFYQQVAGWKVEEIPMKDGEAQYEDYVMKDAEDIPTGGICHLRGVNTGIPNQWILYINVDNLAESIQKASELGGTLVHESRNKEGKLNYVIFQDPSGACFGLASTT